MSDIRELSNEELVAEMGRIEGAWDALIIAKQHDEGKRRYSARFKALCDEYGRRRLESGPAVVRLRFLVGEDSRALDVACGEALGWRVSRDPWWNWHPGPVFDPPGDEWCIRKDGRNDVACNEALPHFTAEMFEKLLAGTEHPGLAPPREG